MPTRIEKRLEPFFWRIIRRVTREDVVDLPQLTPADLRDIKNYFPMEKFFLFGHERSGTALLGRLIRTHPDVHCDWTGHFFTHSPTFLELFRDPKLMEKFYDPNFRWNEGRDSRSLILRALIDFLMEKNAIKLGKKIVGDKSPNTYANDQAIRYMNAVYPDGKLIYIIRDGRDVLISQRFREFIEFPERLKHADRKIRSDYIRNPDPFFENRRSLFTRAGIERRTKIWERNVRLSIMAGRELLSDRFHTLRFEDLLASPDEEVGKIWEFLGVDPSGMVDAIQAEMRINPVVSWQAKKNVEQLKTVSKGKKGSWRELFTPYDRKVFKNLAADLLIQFRYEPDDAW